MNLEDVEVGMKVKVVSLKNTYVGGLPVKVGDIVEVYGVRTKCCGDNNTLELFDEWSISHLDVEHFEEDSSINSQDNDLVNSPKHYATDPSGIECIQIKRKMSANAGDAFKYTWRVGKKWDDKQDLEKALWYINDAIEHEVPVWLDDGVDLETEALIQQVLKHREGWQYMFINALYWSDLEEAKRAVEIGIKQFEDVAGK